MFLFYLSLSILLMILSVSHKKNHFAHYLADIIQSILSCSSDHDEQWWKLLNFTGQLSFSYSPFFFPVVSFCETSYSAGSQFLFDDASNYELFEYYCEQTFSFWSHFVEVISTPERDFHCNKDYKSFVHYVCHLYDIDCVVPINFDRWLLTICLYGLCLWYYDSSKTKSFITVSSDNKSLAYNFSS